MASLDVSTPPVQETTDAPARRQLAELGQRRSKPAPPPSRPISEAPSNQPEEPEENSPHELDVTV